jgi:Flp pilus assembly protein CpaB
MNRLALLRRRVRRTVLARRRPIAAVAAAAAVAAGLHAAADPPPVTTPVLTAARDLPAGVVVRPGDLVRTAFSHASVPDGVLASGAEAVGRTTAAPLRAGEPITDVRLLGGSMLKAYPDAVAAPVRIGDPGAVRLLRVGDQVDVIAADPQTGEAATVAFRAPVVALPGEPGAGSALGGDGTTSGGLVVLAVSEPTARALAGAAVSSYLSLVVDR